MDSVDTLTDGNDMDNDQIKLKLGPALNALRAIKGFSSQGKFAEAIGVSPNTYKKAEKHGVVSEETAVAIEAYTGRTIESIIDWYEESLLFIQGEK